MSDDSRSFVERVVSNMQIRESDEDTPDRRWDIYVRRVHHANGLPVTNGQFYLVTPDGVVLTTTESVNQISRTLFPGKIPDDSSEGQEL